MTNIIGVVKLVDRWGFWSAISKDFTVEAVAEVMYDFYVDFSEELGEPIELDPIAIGCDWHEYDNDKDFISDRGIEYTEEVAEELADIYEGDLYKRRVYRLSNGNLLVYAG